MPRAWPRRLEPLVLAAAGAAQTLAFVHTAWWPLPLLAVALLVARLNQHAPRRAAWLGWCFGTAWLAAGTWWLFVSMHRYGGLPAPLAVAAVVALAAALSLYLALACAAYARWRRGHWAHDAGLFAALWLLAELARGVVFTGFPWVASGYSQVDAPLAWAAPFLGVYGMGALLAGLGAALAFGSPRRPWPLLTLALLLPAALPQATFTQPAGTLGVALLQTNVAQDEKFRPALLARTTAAAFEALASSRAELVVGPETVIPLLPRQLDELAPGAWQALRQRFAESAAQAALFGVPLGDEEQGYTNSVVGLAAASGTGPGGGAGAGGPTGEPYRYDKSHLVPFGEFIPPGFRWFVRMMNIPLGDFSRGARVQPSFVHRGQRLAPNICYEDLFGEELAARFTDARAAPTVLVNISNIGWFGDTIAVPQHLNISRLRSLELERPMLRATNTGATAIVDHRGVVLAQMQPFTRGVLEGRVEGRQGLTPYAYWAGRFGLWPPALLALAVVAGLALRPQRARAA